MIKENNSFIQERKLELQQAISKMEQGGSADGILQVKIAELTNLISPVKYREM